MLEKRGFWLDYSMGTYLINDSYTHSRCFLFGATTSKWARASSITRFLDHNDPLQSAGLLWKNDQLVAET
jgi:hypothetical protein